jgi:hypothetical protein
MERIVNCTKKLFKFVFCTITKHYEHDTHGFVMWLYRWRNILVKQKFQLMPNTLIQPTWFVQGLAILQTTFFVASWGKMRCVPFDFFHFAICFNWLMALFVSIGSIVILNYWFILIFFRIFKLGCYIFELLWYISCKYCGVMLGPRGVCWIYQFHNWIN